MKNTLHFLTMVELFQYANEICKFLEIIYHEQKCQNIFEQIKFTGTLIEIWKYQHEENKAYSVVSCKNRKSRNN